MMTEDEHAAQLVNRLRGIYNIPVRDGLGPLNGSYTFSRQFTGQPEVQGDAADLIEALEDGVAILKSEIEDLIARLLVPDYYMNMPEPYVPPIHEEAAARLQELICK